MSKKVEFWLKILFKGKNLNSECVGKIWVMTQNISIQARMCRKSWFFTLNIDKGQKDNSRGVEKMLTKCQELDLNLSIGNTWFSLEIFTMSKNNVHMGKQCGQNIKSGTWTHDLLEHNETDALADVWLGL